VTRRCARSFLGRYRISVAMTARSAQSRRGLGLVRREKGRISAGLRRRNRDGASSSRPGDRWCEAVGSGRAFLSGTRRYAGSVPRRTRRPSAATR
jgi:hypothetical protein